MSGELEALLLELQEVDTTTDQLTYRRAHLPELTAAQQARADLLAWETQGAHLASRRRDLESTVEAAERESEEIDRHRSRLSAQLSTVIAVREAEALQSEIRGLETRRAALDDAALEAMEALGVLEEEVLAHARLESSLRETLELTDAELSRAHGEIDAQMSALSARGSDLREEVPAQILGHYDRLRAQLGVAVARLGGRRCEGCHMDLSPMEVDRIREVPPGEIAECPQCTRMLVRGAS